MDVACNGKEYNKLWCGRRKLLTWQVTLAYIRLQRPTLNVLVTQVNNWLVVWLCFVHSFQYEQETNAHGRGGLSAFEKQSTNLVGNKKTQFVFRAYSGLEVSKARVLVSSTQVDEHVSRWDWSLLHGLAGRCGEWISHLGTAFWWSELLWRGGLLCEVR